MQITVGDSFDIEEQSDWKGEYFITVYFAQ
jgi:hypothetical protein